jgi:L-cysteine:1D-myo-inositol 2-amino-2-deoxy-alpha-D-glucopyranoside ligase
MKGNNGIQLYNAVTQRIEPFEPRGDTVDIYVCGITPYDTTHLGHAFTYAAFDILIRYLDYRGYPVRYVQNVTDIDDDILRKAREVESDWHALGNEWTAHFIRDMRTLNVRPPDYFPRATDVISEIQETVQDLLDTGVAYEVDGTVYFNIDAWPEYGKLSRLRHAEMLPIANERGNNPDDPNKRDPLDFVLWQAQSPDEPAWDSPWGPGRPGWHIECSTMATRYLANTIDIHGGGADLMFPHHESEIAQSECATGVQPFARFWMHTAMVGHEGEKMSKSLGNLIMVRDLLDEWSPDAIRLYLGCHHYRDAWEYNTQELAAHAERAEVWRCALGTAGGRGPAVEAAPRVAAFVEAMNRDLDTRAAVAELDGLVDDILKGAEAGHEVTAAQDALWDLSQVLGLRLAADGPAPETIAGWNEHLERFAPDDEIDDPVTDVASVSGTAPDPAGAQPGQPREVEPADAHVGAGLASEPEDASGDRASGSTERIIQIGPGCVIGGLAVVALLALAGLAVWAVGRLGSAAPAASPPLASGQVPPSTIVTVNGEPITTRDMDNLLAVNLVMTSLESGQPTALTPEQRQQAHSQMLDQAIRNTLTLQAARSAGIGAPDEMVEAEWLAWLRRSGMTPDQFTAFLNQSGATEQTFKSWLRDALTANLYLQQDIAPSQDPEERMQAYEAWMQQQLQTAQIQLYGEASTP